ncbi:MAG: type II toxin-antitoxin system RelE/ParE family toxin [Planctomycetes bacterium]|nr:type II toxin-antitoxin system RelE/ParE family toxin [Planctomycetota bacterium]
MTKTEIRIFQEAENQVPLLNWLDGLPTKVHDKCTVRIELLAEKGHDLRRPHCDILEQGIHELRIRRGNVNYRILYAYAGQRVVLLSHGLTKEKKVPKTEIQQAVRNLKRFKENPKAHTYTGGL